MQGVHCARSRGGALDAHASGLGGESHGDRRLRALEHCVTHLVDGDSEVVGLVAVEPRTIGGVGSDQPNCPQVLDGGRALQTQLALAHHVLEFVEHHGHSGRTPNAFASLEERYPRPAETMPWPDWWEHWGSAAFHRFVTSVTLGGTSAPAGRTRGSRCLIIPGKPDFLRLARLAAADAGSRAGLTFDEIEDLRIAVDELCHSVMRADGTGVVELIFELGDEGLVRS